METQFQFEKEIQSIYESVKATVENTKAACPKTIEDYIKTNNLDTSIAQEILMGLHIYLEGLVANPRLLLDGFINYTLWLFPTSGGKNEAAKSDVVYILTQRGEAFLKTVFQLYPCPAREGMSDSVNRQPLFIEDVDLNLVINMSSGYLLTDGIEELYREIYQTEPESETMWPQTIQNYLMANNLDIFEAQKILYGLNVLCLDFVPNPRLHLDGFVDYAPIFIETNQPDQFERIEPSDFTLCRRGEALLDRIFQLYTCGPLEVPLT